MLFRFRVSLFLPLKNRNTDKDLSQFRFWEGVSVSVSVPIWRVGIPGRRNRDSIRFWCSEWHVRHVRVAIGGGLRDGQGPPLAAVDFFLLDVHLVAGSVHRVGAV